nr:MAG TPA: hypothetical protein [Caudoviricetes sp.]
MLKIVKFVLDIFISFHKVYITPIEPLPLYLFYILKIPLGLLHLGGISLD